MGSRFMSLLSMMSKENMPTPAPSTAAALVANIDHLTNPPTATTATTAAAATVRDFLVWIITIASIRFQGRPSPFHGPDIRHTGCLQYVMVVTKAGISRQGPR